MFMACLWQSPIFLENLDIDLAKLSSPYSYRRCEMKLISMKRCSALINQCLFPRVLPSLSPALTCAPLLPRSRHERMIHITVDRSDVTRLRQVVMQSCGQCIGLMRLSSLDHTRRMQLCLSVQAIAMATVMDAVMTALPQAEFSVRRVH